MKRSTIAVDEVITILTESKVDAPIVDPYLKRVIRASTNCDLR